MHERICLRTNLESGERDGVSAVRRRPAFAIFYERRAVAPPSDRGAHERANGTR